MTALMKVLLKKIAYICAALVIVAALLVIASRVFTPALDKHRGEAEQWASVLLQRPVTIKNIRLSWHGYQPEIRLNEVTASSPDTHQPILQVRRIGVFISVIKSLWQMKLVPSGIMLSGSNLNIVQSKDGKISIQGLPSFDDFGDQPFPEASVADVMEWLSQQPDIILDNIRLHYQRAGDKELVVTLNHLSLENAGDKHTILGKAILQQADPVEVSTAIQWRGSGTDMAALKVNAYLYVEGVSLAQWLKTYEWHGWQIKSGMASAKIWLDWSDGRLQKVQTNFQGVQLGLHSQKDNAVHYINRLSGDVGWRQDGDSWVFAGDDILVDLPRHLWPVTNFYVELAPTPSGQKAPAVINTGYLDIEDVESFLFATSNLVPDQVRRVLDQLQLKGSLQTVSLVLPLNGFDWKQTVLDTEFSHISFLPQNGMPGIKNLSGLLKWHDQNAEIDLSSHRLLFTYDSVFANVLDADQMDAKIIANYDESHGAWQLRLSSMQLLNADGAFNLKGTALLAPGKLPDVDLKGNFTLAKAKNVARYLPLKVFSAGLSHWLSDAFIAGEVTFGHAELKGNLTDFPFDHDNGKFLITGNVNNVGLSFASDWPELKGVSGKIAFAGSSVHVDVDKGETLGIPFGHVVADIPSMGADIAMLHIAADPVATDFSAALGYVHNSPLRKTLGRILSDVRLTGPIMVGLNLDIPLDKPDQAKVSGLMDIKNGVMNLEPWHLTVNALTGQVHFTEATTTASSIRGKLFNRPLEFSLATVPQKHADAFIRARFANHIALSDIETWLKLPLSTIAKGDTDITGELDMAFDQPIKLRIQSKLVGIDVDLPDQYGKTAQKPIDFDAAITIDQSKPLQVQLTYGKLLSAAAVVDRGDLGEMNLLSASVSSSQMTLLGQELTKVNLEVKPDKPNWHASIVSDQVTGRIDFPIKLSSQSNIVAVLDKLNVQSSNIGSISTDLDPGTLPAISLDVGNAVVNKIPLGRVSIKTSPQANGLNIQVLKIISPLINLQAYGAWSKEKKSSLTTLNGNAISNDVRQLLISFGFDAHNFIVQDGRMRFNVSWEDVPYAFVFAKMNGVASFELGKGRIADIGKENDAKMGLGRLLSLFSLQTIPRRLSLDFSDVFQKGYSFDSVKGDFKIDDGDVYTSNFRFDGPVAKLGINGRIGLKNHDFDIVLSITPYVTSSIPVAATLLVNPFVGLGALAVNTVVGSQISKASTYYYNVTGSWNNPSWKSVSTP